MDLASILHVVTTFAANFLGSFFGNRALAKKVDQHETTLAEHTERIGKLEVRVTVLEAKQ